jgi:WD40 repeat protein
MIRRSCSQLPSDERPRDVLPHCAPPCGRVRFPFLNWAPIVGLGVLASVLFYLAGGAIRNPREADRNLLGQHINSVESVACDPAGRWLASAGVDRCVYLWDFERRELAMVLDRATESAETFSNRVAFTPDGAALAVANYDGSVTLWDVASGDNRHNFRASTPAIRCVAFSPDGRLLATRSADQSIALWDMATLRRRRAYSEVAGRSTVSCSRPLAGRSPGARLTAASSSGMPEATCDFRSCEATPERSCHWPSPLTAGR